MTANGITKPNVKAAQDLTGAVQSSLWNHNGKRVQTVGDGIAGRGDSPGRTI